MLQPSLVAPDADSLPAPLFELKGAAAGFDLSAIISAAALGGEALDIGLRVIADDYVHKGLGLYVLMACYIIFLVCVAWLQKSMRLSPIAKTFGKARTLTTDGMYKYTRNPIYLVSTLPLASFAYFSPSVAFLSITLYVTLMNLTVIRKEERELQQAFGADYTAYRKAVPRWIC
jgi:Phospholipid methyltransferase